jgi:hypothetical protein
MGRSLWDFRCYKTDLEETMGDTQVGGNLSVHWLVNADDVDNGDVPTLIHSQRRGARQWFQHGADHHRNTGGSGQSFRIRIKLPQNNPAAFLTAVQTAISNAQVLGRLEFDLEIEKGAVAHTQIQIAWARGQGQGIPPWSDDLPNAPTQDGGGGPGSAQSR